METQILDVCKRQTTENGDLIAQTAEQERPIINKLTTKILANFSLTAYAYQILHLKSTEITSSLLEDPQNVALLKAQTELAPFLESQLTAMNRKIVHCMAVALIREILKDQTRTDVYGVEVAKAIESTHHDIRREYYNNYIAHGGRKEDIPKYFMIPVEYTWKLQTIERGLEYALVDGDTTRFKSLLIELTTIAKTLISKKNPQWVFFTDRLSDYASNDDLGKNIVDVNWLINAKHQRGDMLEHTSVNYLNSIAFLNAQKNGDDWLVRAIADKELWQRIQEFKQLIPLENFNRPT